VLGVQPRELLIGIERCLPYKAAVRSVFHSEKREIKARKVVVVDPTIDERCRQADLANVLFLKEYQYKLHCYFYLLHSPTVNFGLHIGNDLQSCPYTE
jgi:hypothetical protein